MDVYHFEAAASTSVYFDELSSNLRLNWRCVDEDGAEVFPANNILESLDIGPVVLERGGRYTISVFGSGDATGSYSFSIRELPPPESFEIAIGDVVSEGAPGPGAGSIEVPGAIDTYGFQVAAGTCVRFRELSVSLRIQWRCIDERGVEVFPANNLVSGHDVGPVVLERGGPYTISVFGSGDSTGTYSFELTPCP